ncbi:hypothetical protein [Oleiharenicola lentus]|uniref:hypothetical protein n=1 Tax=Oleiharenicola lentus TaxID=2508720 RepID=UPI003F66BE74
MLKYSSSPKSTTPAYFFSHHSIPQMPTLLAPAADAEPKIPQCNLEQLLVEVPINSVRLVANFFTVEQVPSVNWPANIRHHCSVCDGVRRHELRDRDSFNNFKFSRYTCVDCVGQSAKSFGVSMDKRLGVGRAECHKVFQSPSFGSPIPRGIYKLIGEENRDMFLQARRSIARGLGVGAYAYYRRIVESNKLTLVNSVLDVAVKTGAPVQQVYALKAAAEERQFSKALEILKSVDAIPAVLLIGGHNPLGLLHDELSEGIHTMSDAECLQRAQHAETILGELARLMNEALTERNEVKSALAAVMNRKKSS